MQQLLKISLIISLYFVFINIGLGQAKQGEVPHPKFSPFKGMVYDMPALTAPKGKGGKYISIGIQEYYTDTIYSYPEIGEITLDKINVPETNTKEGKFPGVDKTVKFAMILHAKMEILVDGCYEFSLSSDDGSRLWVDEQQIVNNDGGHKMKTSIDSVAFRKGNYDAKLWYFQGMPDRFGLKMDAKIIGKPEVCPVEIEKREKKENKIITLQHILFQHDRYTISQDGMKELEKAAEEIKLSNSKLVHIIGHTDNIGTVDYNQKLSLLRAENIKSNLEKLLNDNSIKLLCFGEGDSKPKASNDTPEGQKINRRVELVLKY